MSATSDLANMGLNMGCGCVARGISTDLPRNLRGIPPHSAVPGCRAVPPGPTLARPWPDPGLPVHLIFSDCSDLLLVRQPGGVGCKALSANVKRRPIVSEECDDWVQVRTVAWRETNRERWRLFERDKAVTLRDGHQPLGHGAPWCGDMGLGDVDEPFQERIGAEAIADCRATLFLACCVIVS
jgi:hypothetical protein